MLSKSQKRVVLGTAILVVVVLFVVPAINVNRFRLSVARALSEAIGRNVTVQSISIQTFPQPGLLLNGVVVEDDPSISAEPMLRADEVLATLRLSSLWRGRLEVGTLQLKYPSLNVVRANDGRWNLQSLLERARQTPSAPTAKTRPETRPRFPYIESDTGRINLKIGNEKKVFALSDADFAIWLASEDEWRMRLEARPIRTDANLSDTGTLKVQGSWRRAPDLHDTPISLSVSWEQGQLGQITHLIYGRDRGWRGAVRLFATVSGKPDKLELHLDTRIEDFRRYDIVISDSVSLELHCNSEYNFSQKKIENVACQMPAGSGVVLANGSYDFMPKPHIDLSITAENVPTQYLATLARHAKRDLPSDMRLTGMVSASLAVKGDYGNHTWTGNGQMSDVELQSSVLSSPLVLEASRWMMVGPGAEAPPPVKTLLRNRRGSKKAAPEDLPAPTGLAWKLTPVALKLHDGSPATLSGWFSKDGYYTDIRGEADLSRVFEMARLAGLPSPVSEIDGNAKGAVQVSGAWAGFVPATITAEAQLKNVTAKLAGVASPLKIVSGQFIATPQAFILDKATGSFAGVHGALELQAQWTQHCVRSPQNNCAFGFHVGADQLNVDEVNSLLNPRAQKRPWYAALANTVMGASRAKFPEIYAHGQIGASKLIWKSITATHFNSSVTITPSGFSVGVVSADVFGGRYSGNVTANLTSGAPFYASEGQLQNVTMANVASVMKDPWASGVANLEYKAQFSGWNSDELLSSAAGTGTFNWHDGVLPHIELGSAGKTLQFKSFSGNVELNAGVLTLAPSKLQANSGIYLVSGTASLGRRLEMRITREGAPSYSITGTLERPTTAVLREPASPAKSRASSNR